MNTAKDLQKYLTGDPPGLKVNAVQWLQKKIMAQTRKLPHEFNSRSEWESFRVQLRSQLPKTIGIPRFPALKESAVRGCIRVGRDVICERVDVFADDDYAIPCFVFRPANSKRKHLPALLWNPGYGQDKWDKAYLAFSVRLARQGYVVLVLDHAPFGETGFVNMNVIPRMTLIMGMGHVLGWSQLGVRAAETMRCGEYLRARPDVDPSRVALAGLCQGGQDTWLAAALDDRFCAAAPICSASTFAVHFAEMASYQVNSDSSPFPFGILKVCDVEHLHAAIAPRPLLVRANLGDNWWPVSGFDVIESFTRRIYRLYKAENRIDFRAEAHEHNLTGPFADALEAFLLRYV